MKRAVTDVEREVAELERALKVAQKKSEKAMEAKMRLALGSTRARVTTANANWARAAEARDRVSDQLDAARARLAAEQAGAR